MILLILVLHVLIVIALVGVVLMQKSEGGALGIGGGGMSGFMTGRSTANLLTRATAILAALFMTTSVLLVVLSNQHPAARSILGGGTATQPAIPAAPSPAVPATPGRPAAPPAPAAPTAPRSH
jgi:preprotein translocase subunit SecG